MIWLSSRLRDCVLGKSAVCGVNKISFDPNKSGSDDVTDWLWKWHARRFSLMNIVRVLWLIKYVRVGDWPKSLSTVYSCNMLYMTLAYTFPLLWGFNILLEVSVLLLSCHSHIYAWSQPMASDLLRCTFPQCTEGLALTESHLYLDHVSYIVCKYNNIIKYKPFRKRRCYHGTGGPSNLIMSTYSAV